MTSDACGCAGAVWCGVPPFPLPLGPGETEPPLPLNHILHELYDQGGYDLIIDYRQSSQPPLSAADAEWAKQLVTQSGRTCRLAHGECKTKSWLGRRGGRFEHQVINQR